MGSAQPGLPCPGTISSFHYRTVLDIKDCFFPIPLALQDWACFAFTVWKLNMHKPAKRYQWVVLPQGMKNSHCICQLYVTQGLISVPKDIILVHYMDVHPNSVYLQRTVKLKLPDLALLKLWVAPDEIQTMPPFAFLGFVIAKDIRPQPFKLNIKKWILPFRATTVVWNRQLTQTCLTSSRTGDERAISTPRGPSVPLSKDWAHYYS